jgi:hypothetical protein
VLAEEKICAWLGKTRGAFGFALIFLWFLSLYQDKERNDNKAFKRRCCFIFLLMTTPTMVSKIRKESQIIVKPKQKQRKWFLI